MLKKLSILAIICSLFLSVGVSAQSASSKDEKGLTSEQKMLPFAMAMSLSVLGEMHDENYSSALSVFQKQISAYSAELKPVVELKKDVAEYVRLDVAQTATVALRKKASASDRWQMLVGERFGTIYVQIKKNKQNGDEINADDLRFSIETIGILASRAPADIPQEIVKKFKKFGELKNADDLTSDENVEEITETVIGILNVISN